MNDDCEGSVYHIPFSKGAEHLNNFKYHNIRVMLLISITIAPIIIQHHKRTDLGLPLITKFTN